MEWKWGESFEAFYTHWWRRRATINTPNQEKTEAKTRHYTNRLDTATSRRRSRNATPTQQDASIASRNKHTSYGIPNIEQRCNRIHREHQENHQTFQMDQLIQAVSNITIQSNLTNQAMLSFFSSQTDRHTNHPDPQVRPKSFSGLSSEDILSWLILRWWQAIISGPKHEKH